jgi:hypothetical protein
MALLTRASFYYGHIVTDSNKYININEGSGELTATLSVGNYSLSQFALEVQKALRDAGALDYIVTINRTTRKITISAASNFSILGATGTQAAQSALSLLGFAASDFTGASSYLGANASGSEYRPQFPFIDYIPTTDWQEAVDATVNKSGSGKIEVVKYGIQKFMECEIDYITDTACGIGSMIESDPSGVSNARALLQYLIEKGLVEFMPDRDQASTFETFILEKTDSNQLGLGYRLREKIGDGLAGFYSTGRLTFRLIEA